jgi:hypothetical protein
MRPFSWLQSSKTSKTWRWSSIGLGMSPAFVPILLRAPWFPFVAKILTLMMCLRESRLHMHLSLCGTSAYLFRFGAFGEEIFNTLRINVPVSFQLGMGSPSTWPAAPLLLNRSLPPKLSIIWLHYPSRWALWSSSISWKELFFGRLRALPPGRSVKWIGKLCAAPKSMVALGC